jgi:hypothetical protein
MSNQHNDWPMSIPVATVFASTSTIIIVLIAVGALEHAFHSNSWALLGLKQQ